MKTASTQLQAVLQEAGAAMYQSQQAAGGAPSPDGDAGSSDEDVIEGEFSDA